MQPVSRGAATSVLIAMVIGSSVRADRITFDDSGVLQVNGRKTFVISFGMPPPADGKTPEGKNAFAELRDAGATFVRIAPRKDEPEGSESAMRRLRDWLDAAAAHDMHCWVTLGQLPAIKPGEVKKEQLLRRIIATFKDHPALGGWKAFDEAAWVKMPVGPVLAAYRIFHGMDPDHPVILIQAPTKASLPLEPYSQACDVTGVDIYPIAYPPGWHSDFGNREISIVSDCTQWIRKAAQGKPVWMTLQIAWGATAAPGKFLRFPTFPQERYMAYAAIINGARGINYQGGALPLTLNERDAKLGWNWTFWKKVMRPLLEELGDKSPVHPALLAPESKLPVRIEGTNDVEFCVREVRDEIFILAAKREGPTSKVKFTGLPPLESKGAVLFEEPRTIAVAATLEDWFGPNEVHVYRLRRR